MLSKFSCLAKLVITNAEWAALFLESIRPIPKGLIQKQDAEDALLSGA